VGTDLPQHETYPASVYDDAAFLRGVLDGVPAFVVLIDPALRMRYINRLQPGYSLEEVLGRSIEDFTAPEQHAVQRKAVEDALRTGESQTFLIRGDGGQGRTAHYESRAVPVNDSHGRRAVCIIALEVTEHVARAEALKQSEEKLRLAVDATGIGLWTYDIPHNRVEWSARMHEIMGRAEPVNLRDYVSLVHPDDRARIEHQELNLQGGSIDFLAHRIVRGDGEVRWLVPTGRVQQDEHGRPLRIMGGTLDVTAQQRVEEHLRHAQKMDAVGALTAGVAHNFNNMLAVIMPALEIAVRTGDDAHRKLYSDAAHASRRAAELVAQLMTFAGQRRSSAPESVHLAPIILRAISMCEQTFSPHLDIDSAIDGGCAPVRCDAAAIEQVVVNLLINARDAITTAERDRPRLRMELAEVSATPPGRTPAPERRYVRISVRDNGVGMSAEVKRHLFEPFFTTKGPGRGTGLGLATSYAIVRDQDGFITVDSTEGVGTSLEIHLPLAEHRPDTQHPASADVPSARSGVVLIVDDEPAVLGAMAGVLRGHGHVVMTASDGRAAVALLDAGQTPELVLLDRAMPGWPVRTVLAELRKRIPEVPILFFTGHDVGDDDRSLVQGVLHKPASIDELLATVERWLPR
jgi:two-component system, cell cycle sensor histidine kinase and response regulator CckA